MVHIICTVLCKSRFITVQLKNASSLYHPKNYFFWDKRACFTIWIYKYYFFFTKFANWDKRKLGKGQKWNVICFLKFEMFQNSKIYLIKVISVSKC